MSDEFVPPEETPEDAAFLVDGLPKDHPGDDGLTLGQLLSAEPAEDAENAALLDIFSEPEENEQDTKELTADATLSLADTEYLRPDFGSREPASEPPEAQPDEPSPGFLRRAIGWFFAPVLPKQDGDSRLYHLSQAITTYPDAPTNYVLRGELYLELDDYAQAVADFRRALELASAQIETDRWGLVAQAAQDRALAGLRKAQKKVGRR